MYRFYIPDRLVAITGMWDERSSRFWASLGAGSKLWPKGTGPDSSLGESGCPPHASPRPQLRGGFYVGAEWPSGVVEKTGAWCGRVSALSHSLNFRMFGVA